MGESFAFQKPSRYINSEYNAVHKKAPVSVALAFPDIYDVECHTSA